MPRILMLIFLVVATPPAAFADITTGLVGFWPFTGDAQDASGNGNHGSLVNAPTLTVDRHGVQDAAFHFNGLNTRIDVAPSASLAAPTTAITMAAYIRRDGWGMVGSQYNPILTKSIAAANDFQYRFIVSQSGSSLGTIQKARASWSRSSEYPATVTNWNTGRNTPTFPDSLRVSGRDARRFPSKLTAARSGGWIRRRTLASIEATHGPDSSASSHTSGSSSG